MSQVIKIGCPKCGAVLSVQDMPGIEAKHVTCPICKSKGLFTSFRRIEDKDNETQIPDTLSSKPDGMAGIGVLLVGDKEFPLRSGRNEIGRAAAGNTANVQIPAHLTSKRMSRQHIVIEVKQLPSGYYQHQISLYKPEVNSTYLNNEKLAYGDTFVLLPGSIIKLPDCEVRFADSNKEMTYLDDNGTQL